MIFSLKIPCIYTDTIRLVAYSRTVETIFTVVIQTIKWHDCYKIRGNCFCVPLCFLINQNILQYINIKIEMNLCSDKTAKLADVSPLKETVA